MTETGPNASPYPRFSDAEMQRRREALAATMAERGVEHALLYGSDRSGSAIPWLTRWPVTREALAVFTPGERDALLVNFHNHVPNAERIATEAEVRWAGNDPIGSAIEELARRGARANRVGLIGPLRHRYYLELDEFTGELVSLDRAYTRLRLTKSDEELEWLRLGANLTDSAVRAIHEAAAPGVDERELGDMAERAYVGRGGTTHIHYFGATPMDDPDQSVPAQWPAARRLERGDALTCEVSASFWGYPGQLLRTFAVASDPSPLYRELHDAADAAFDAILARVRPGAAAAELVEASAVIEESGFTTRDDLVHGFVGGYLPPVLGSASRQLAPVPDVTLEAGMTLVVQPNPITPDGRAGVQTGELVLVTPAGAKRLHDFPRGLLRAPTS